MPRSFCLRVTCADCFLFNYSASAKASRLDGEKVDAVRGTFLPAPLFP
jgi:hypothetical protein